MKNRGPAVLDAVAFVSLNKSKIERYEQHCDKCKQWYEVPLDKYLPYVDYMHANGAGPMTGCTCTKCGASEMFLYPGKYDHINEKNPILQRFTFKK